MSPIERWFKQRGWTPFDFQREAWQAYADGASGLVHAPTGVGKTYAVWLGPVGEALAEAPRAKRRLAKAATEPAGESRRLTIAARRATSPPLRVLWITPLRALANDTLLQLLAATTELGLNWTVELRTGDTSAGVRARQRERLPTALVTTPESLTLQLSYPDAREKLASLRCVIVDEWHELLGTKRGVQTELALARLRRWNPDLRIWGLSATLGNLDEARDVLLGPSAAPRGRLISGQMPKDVTIETLLPESIERFPWSGHIGTRLTPDVARVIREARSTLLFCNTRAQAEIWFQALLRHDPSLIGEIALHHGSLDRDLRGRVEALLAAGKLRCVVCTSSLDLGVDFSPVDQVIQVGSPKGIARLMQRAGRSGHQPGARSRVICVPAHAFELVEFAAVRDAMAARKIEGRRPLRRPLDLLVQHLVTIALGGGFEEAALRDEVRDTHAFAELTDDEWRWTLQFAWTGGPTLTAYPDYQRLTRDADGRFVVASPRVAKFHRLSIGTITGENSISVRYMSGGTLGTIEESFISRLNRGDRFVFAGRVLELVQVRAMTAFVRKARDPRGTVPRWSGGRFPLSTQLADAVRAKLHDAKRGDVRQASAEIQAIEPILALQGYVSHLPDPDELLIETTRSRDGHHWFLYPFEGRLVHEGLASLLAYRLTRREARTVNVTVNDYGIELLSPDELPLDEPAWRELLRADELLEDLLACLNETELARRQFRSIARVVGLVFAGYPGMAKSTRHLQASSELFFDVFTQFDPENLLLDQARREVLEEQLEVARLRDTLARIVGQKFVIISTARLSPLGFPIWADRLRAQQLSSEAWTDRVRKMAARLDADADRTAAPPASAPPRGRRRR